MAKDIFEVLGITPQDSVDAYIIESLAKGKTVSEIARELGVSQPAITKRLKNRYGLTPRQIMEALGIRPKGGRKPRNTTPKPKPDIATSVMTSHSSETRVMLEVHGGKYATDLSYKEYVKLVEGLKNSGLLVDSKDVTLQTGAKKTYLKMKGLKMPITLEIHWRRDGSSTLVVGGPESEVNFAMGVITGIVGEKNWRLVQARDHVMRIVGPEAAKIPKGLKADLGDVEVEVDCSPEGCEEGGMPARNMEFRGKTPEADTKAGLSKEIMALLKQISGAKAIADIFMMLAQRLEKIEKDVEEIKAWKNHYNVMFLNFATLMSKGFSKLTDLTHEEVQMLKGFTRVAHQQHLKIQESISRLIDLMQKGHYRKRVEKPDYTRTGLKVTSRPKLVEIELPNGQTKKLTWEDAYRVLDFLEYMKSNNWEIPAEKAYWYLGDGYGLILADLGLPIEIKGDVARLIRPGAAVYIEKIIQELRRKLRGGRHH